MNKLITSGKIGIVAVSLTLFAVSCKKDTSAFPTKPSANGTSGNFVYDAPSLPVIKDADGIIAAVHAHNYRIVTISPFEQEFQYGLAAFTNTTGNFSSLVSGGSLTVDTSALTPNSAYLYQSYPTTYSLNFTSAVTWNITGAGSVPAMTYTVAAGNTNYSLLPSTATSYWKDEWVPTPPKTLVVPVLGGNTHADTVKYQTALTQYHNDSLYNATACISIPVKNYVTNTDSVVVTWRDDGGYFFTKKTAATDSLALFTPNDFAGNTNYNIDNNFKMEISLVKYYPVLSGGKKYYYIRMGSYIKYWRTN